MKQGPFTSPKSLKRTIETDLQVYHWFNNLITSPEINKDLVNKNMLSRLKMLERSHRLFMYFTILSVLNAVFTNQYYLFLVTAALFVCSKVLARKARRIGAEISLKMIEGEIDAESLKDMTLYQIGEVLARKYHVSPLLKTLTGMNNMIRLVILFAFIMITVITPFDFQQTLIAILIMVLLIDLINNTPAVYRSFKVPAK